MVDRNIASNFLLGVLESYVAWCLIVLSGFLAAALVPPARRAIDWLSRHKRDVRVQLTGQRIGATLGALAVVMTPAAGTLGVVGSAAIVERSDLAQIQGTASMGSTASR